MFHSLLSTFLHVAGETYGVFLFCFEEREGMKHPNDRTGQLASLLGDVNYKPTTEPIPGSTPWWGFERRARTIYHTHMQDKEMLKDGFGPFLATVQASTKLVDSAKRHYNSKESEEQSWRSSVHAVPEVHREPHASGKRPAPHSFPLDGQEYFQIPRGKKHCEPPADRLGDEMDVFQSRIGVVRDASGYPVRSAHCAPTETASFSGLPQRTHLTQGERNRVPCTVLGDKPYSAVELSSEFRFAEKHRMGLEPPGKPFQIANTFEAKEKAQRLQRDIVEVQSLPKYPKEQATSGNSSKAAPVPAGGKVTPVDLKGKK